MRKYIAIDIAIKNGALAGDGWENTESEDVASFIKFLESHNIKMFVITDVSKDGMMQGINNNSIEFVLKSVTTKAIISGGVTTKEDVQNILGMNKSIVDGMIIGKALYEQSISLTEVINECR